MFMISKYSLKSKSKSYVSVECTDQILRCPSCGGQLHYRDSRKRSMRMEGGEKLHLQVCRFRCKRCRHYHTELPDCVVPYKHYVSEVICGVLDGVVGPDDLDAEVYPSAMTMLRWLQWFLANIQNMEGHLHRTMMLLRQFCGNLPKDEYIVLYLSDSKLTPQMVLQRAAGPAGTGIPVLPGGFQAAASAGN